VGLAVLLWYNRSDASTETPSRVFVYVQTEMTPRAFGRELSLALSGFDVKVFGRLGDFKTAIKNEKPEVVLARTPVLINLGIEPAIQGIRNEQSTEPLVLLSVDSPVEMDTVTTKIVGVVDLLGRQGMTGFVSDVLKAKPAKIKRTSKIQDLLGLLQSGAADAVLLPERFVETLKKDSKLDLRVTPLTDATVGLPAVAVSQGVSRESIAAAIRRIGANLSEKMGVDQWN